MTLLDSPRFSFRLALLALCAVMLCGWSPDSAKTGATTLYSQSFQFHGTCTDKDMVYSWKIDSGPKEQTSFIHPWMNSNIAIRGVELATIAPAQGVSFWMVGNNADGDAMIFMTADQLHAMNWFPRGFAFQFPSVKNARETDYIDLHGSCKTGAPTIMLTIYYTVPSRVKDNPRLGRAGRNQNAANVLQ